MQAARRQFGTSPGAATSFLWPSSRRWSRTRSPGRSERGPGCSRAPVRPAPAPDWGRAVCRAGAGLRWWPAPGPRPPLPPPPPPPPVPQGRAGEAGVGLTPTRPPPASVWPGRTTGSPSRPRAPGTGGATGLPGGSISTTTTTSSSTVTGGRWTEPSRATTTTGPSSTTACRPGRLSLWWSPAQARSRDTTMDQPPRQDRLGRLTRGRNYQNNEAWRGRTSRSSSHLSSLPTPSPGRTGPCPAPSASWCGMATRRLCTRNTWPWWTPTRAEGPWSPPPSQAAATILCRARSTRPAAVTTPWTASPLRWSTGELRTSTPVSDRPGPLARAKILVRAQPRRGEATMQVSIVDTVDTVDTDQKLSLLI